jgi:MFS family permease
MSWLGTGISVGVALGATAAGFILDALGPRWGYAFAAASGVTTVVIYLSGLPRLARAEPATPVAASAASSAA